jgi:hypothetical protein
MLKFFARISLLVLLVVGSSEVAIRMLLSSQLEGVAQLTDFYHSAEKKAQRKGLDLLFVGTSRVAAAVDAEIARRELESRGRSQVGAVNVGKGYSTHGIHYLGIRNLYEKYPQKVGDMTVLVEAPSGVPEIQEKNGEWVSPRWPVLFGPVATMSDASRFVVQSSNDFDTKIAALLSIPLLSVRYYMSMRQGVKKRANGVWGIKPEEKGNLAEEGGIRTDSVGIEAAREMVMGKKGKKIKKEEGFKWGNSFLASIANLVRSRGGEVVFFRMPESSIEKKIGPSDSVRSSFHRWRKQEEIPLFHLQGFQTTNKDFPDLLHLRKSRSKEYTTRLVDALVEHERLLPE